MKKKIFILVLMILCLTACKDEDVVITSNETYKSYSFTESNDTQIDELSDHYFTGNYDILVPSIDRSEEDGIIEYKNSNYDIAFSFNQNGTSLLKNKMNLSFDSSKSKKETIGSFSVKIYSSETNNSKKYNVYEINDGDLTFSLVCIKLNDKLSQEIDTLVNEMIESIQMIIG